MLISKSFVEKLYKFIPSSLAVVLNRGCDFLPQELFAIFGDIFGCLKSGKQDTPAISHEQKPGVLLSILTVQPLPSTQDRITWPQMSTVLMLRNSDLWFMRVSISMYPGSCQLITTLFLRCPRRWLNLQPSHPHLGSKMEERDDKKGTSVCQFCFKEDSQKLSHDIFFSFSWADLSFRATLICKRGWHSVAPHENLKTCITVKKG